MNERIRSALPSWPNPSWLNGPTAAIIGTVFTVGVAVAGMDMASTSALRAEMRDMRKDIEKVRKDLGADIEKVSTDLDARMTVLETRLRGVETGVAVIRESLSGLDVRLRIVEDRARHAPRPAQDAAPSRDSPS